MTDPQTTISPDCATTFMAKSCNPAYVGGMICRAYYPGDSACTEFGGKAKCLSVKLEEMQNTAMGALNGI